MRNRTLEEGDANTAPETVYQSWSGICGDPWRKITGDVTYTTSCYPWLKTTVTNDVVTPNFHRKKNQGEIINNPYDSTKTILTESEVSYLSEIIDWVDDCGPDGVGRYSGSSQSGSVGSRYACRKGGSSWTQWYPPQPSISVEAMKSAAVTQAHANTSANEAAVLCTLAEANKSVIGILYILKRLRKIYKGVRKLDLKLLKNEISRKEFTNRYMEARYSIRPLVYDARQVYAAFNKGEMGKMRQTSRGFRTASDQISTTTTGRTVGSIRTTLSGTSERTVEVRAGVLSDIEVGPLSIWGLDQPIEAIWEIVPFSFVVDWFLNVGNTIASWTPQLGIKELASWCVVRDVTLYTVWVSDSWIDPASIGPNNYSAKYEVEGATHTKTVDSTIRSVNPKRSVIPVIDTKLDGLKLLDLTILLRNFYK